MRLTDGPPATVEIEALRFLAPDGALLVESSLAFSMDDARKRVAATRLGDGIGLGLAQFVALSDSEVAERQPLRTAEGRWADDVLLPAISAAVDREYPLQA